MDNGALDGGACDAGAIGDELYVAELVLKDVYMLHCCVMLNLGFVFWTSCGMRSS